MAFFGRFIMLYSIKPLHLHCVFHGIRFKVNKDWVSGIDTLLFLYTPSDSIPAFPGIRNRLLLHTFPIFGNIKKSPFWTD